MKLSWTALFLAAAESGAVVAAVGPDTDEGSTSSASSPSKLRSSLSESARSSEGLSWRRDGAGDEAAAGAVAVAVIEPAIGSAELGPALPLSTLERFPVHSLA